MRTLRLGDRGKDVLRLHEFLRLQGYDLGEEDYFGYLTKYAVVQFQKEHGIVPDGIAGKHFFALAYDPDLPIRRRTHIVATGETLEQIADKYQMGKEAFNHSRRVDRLFPGQRLLFFEREIWGMVPEQKNPTAPRELTGLIHTQLPIESPTSPCVFQTSDFPPRIPEELLNKFCGLYLAVNQIHPLQGGGYQKQIKKIRRQLPKDSMLWIELGPKIPARTCFGGLDYGVVNKLVDRVVLSLSPPLHPGPSLDPRQSEELLASLGPKIHPWKVLLKIPLYALEWKIQEDDLAVIKLPYSTALSRAFRHGARLEKDQGGNLYYRYQSKGVQYQLWLPQISAICDLLNLTNRHNLAGVILEQLGMEDPRLWSVIFNYFHLARL